MNAAKVVASAVIAIATIALSGCSRPPLEREDRLTSAVERTRYAVGFVADSDDMVGDSGPLLALIATHVLAGGRACVDVVGAIEQSRSVPYRDAMSIRRATAIQQALVSLGVSAEKIWIFGAEAEGMLPTIGIRRNSDPALTVQIMIGRKHC